MKPVVSCCQAAIHHLGRAALADFNVFQDRGADLPTEDLALRYL